MKAVVRHEYGSPDVLKLEEVEKPTPTDDEVLIKVHAVSASAADRHFLIGAPFLIRLMDGGLLKPRMKILGADIAGTVEAVGKNIELLKPGDEVFGDISECGWGGYAEYVCASENAVVLKPANITFEEAATVPMSSITALKGLRDWGKIQQGQKVLINGASGGVGTFAVQIAKSFGAEVTAVCSTRNLEMVRSIGADQVIDYTQEDFTKTGQLYDLILDAAAYRLFSHSMRALSPKGIYVMVGGSMASLVQSMVFGPLVSLAGSKKIRTFVSSPDKKDLTFMKELLETKKVVPVIAGRYTLGETPEALRYLLEGHTQGKVVMTV